MACQRSKGCYVLKKLQNKEEILQAIRGSIELALNFIQLLWILLFQLRVRYDSSLSLKNRFSVVQMIITSNDSLVYIIGALNIWKKTLEARSVTSPRNRLPIHLSNYWGVDISNYVYNSNSMITKIYIFLLHFASVSLLIMRMQPALIAWTVTSTATFYHCLSYTDHSVLWIRCVVCIWY